MLYSTIKFLSCESSGPQTTTTPQRTQSAKSAKDVLAGKASGKRRLSDMSECEKPLPSITTDENGRPAKRPFIAHSKFFGPSPRILETPNSSKTSSRLPLLAPGEQIALSEIENIDLFTGQNDVVTQEDGYLSPASSSGRSATPDFSSPARPPKASTSADDDDFDAEVLSSPMTERTRRTSGPSKKSQPAIFVRSSVERDIDDVGIDIDEEGPDLRGAFGDGDELTSEVDCAEPENSFTSTTSSSVSGPFTPVNSRREPFDNGPVLNLDEADGDEIDEAPLHRMRTDNVADGWAQKWAYGGAKSIVRLES